MRASALVAGMMLLLTGCLPPGLRVYVSENGCTPDGVCWHGGGASTNFYDAPARAVVLLPGQPVQVMAHELCHAHQHEMILQKDPTSNDLMAYFSTSEGQSYMTLTGQMPSEATLEDNAWVCAYYLLGQPQDPARERWAEEYLP